MKQNLASKRVIVSPFLVPLAAGQASSDSLLRLADQIESSLIGGRSIGNWLQKTLRLSEQPARALANHLTEYDRNLATLLRVVAGVRPQPGMDLYIVGSRIGLSRLGALSREEAFDWLRQGKADALLIDAGMEPDLSAGGRLFGSAGNHQYMLYSGSQTGQLPTE